MPPREPSDVERSALALLSDARRRLAAFRARHGDVEAYAEDPLRDI
jgi:hypothetical protein